MKSPRAIAAVGIGRLIDRMGVDATGLQGEGTVRGLFAADLSDPHGLDPVGEENLSSPNRYHFTSLDPDGVLVETHTYRIGADTFKAVDIDRVLMDGGVLATRATLSKYNREA